MTGTAVAHQRQAAINHWDDGFQRLVTQTVLKPKNRTATPAELALLAEHAIRTGLDPMARQIYGIYRYDKRAGGEVMTLQVGIDGLRTIAERTGVYLGQDGPYWCGEDAVWTDVWLQSDPPRAARVVVRKVIGGQVAETPAVAHFDEYAPRKQDGSLMGLWVDKPALMLAKCAEALALRKAFPQDMSGLYTDDEMARSDARPVQPPEVPAGPTLESVLPPLPVVNVEDPGPVSDVPSDLPWEPPAPNAVPDKPCTMCRGSGSNDFTDISDALACPRCGGDGTEPEDRDRVDEQTVLLIAAELKRTGVKASELRDMIRAAGADDLADRPLRSREDVLAMLGGLSGAGAAGLMTAIIDRNRAAVH